MKDNYLDLAEILYLTKDNSRFYLTENGFPAMEAVLPKRNDDLELFTDTTPVKQDFGRVYFHRCFPFETPDKFISVLDKDGREYGLIEDIDLLDEDAKSIIKSELDRKYLCPTVKKINSLKDKLGYSYWEVETDMGDMTFSTHDTYRNMAKVGDGMVIITDVDGNRYRIQNVADLDKKSYKKIELFL